VIHYLQQDVKMSDAPSRSHPAAARRAASADRLGQQSALIEADVARRRADQPAHRVPLHVLRHVEANQLDSQRERQLLGNFRLADTVGH